MGLCANCKAKPATRAVEGEEHLSFCQTCAEAFEWGAARQQDGEPITLVVTSAVGAPQRVEWGEGYISILDGEGEVVRWTEDEWVEDPQVVFSIANATRMVGAGESVREMVDVREPAEGSGLWRTRILVDVLSVGEGPPELGHLGQVAHAIDKGDCLGHVYPHEHTELTRRAFEQACYDAGSDPEFFFDPEEAEGD